MSATLVAKDLAGGHAHRTLFESLDLTVAPGDVVGVVGANGAGKTTLLRILAGDLDAAGRHRLDRTARRLRRLAAAGARARRRARPSRPTSPDAPGAAAATAAMEAAAAALGPGVPRGRRRLRRRASTAGWPAAPPTSTTGSGRCWPTSASTSGPTR